MQMEPLLVGGFEVGAPIGAGGMGTVFRATHTETGAAAAVKVISQGDDPAAVRAFRREVQAHAALLHPGVAYLFEYGVLDDRAAAASGGTFVAGSPFVVMELADRGTVDRLSITSWRDVRAITAQVLEALAYAHACGVVHRDLKPQNLLVFGEGEVRVKLTDFGIAHAFSRVEGEEAESLDGAFGTPSYMPPEQVRGRWRDYGPWTDIYALGCVVYELVSGRLPFPGTNGLAIALKHVTEERPPLQSRFPTPGSLQRWIHRAMSIDPSQRFRRASEALWALPDVGEVARETFAAVDVGGATSKGDETIDDLATPGFVEATTLDVEGPPTAMLGDVVESGPTSAVASSDLLSGPPPVPVDWERDHDRVAPSFVGAGLGLFGLRQPPFVGRREERDAIWRAFHQSATDPRFEVVFIEGEAGVGKSRLAESMVRRAHEIGSATVLHAAHQPDGTPGLRGLLRKAMRAWMLSRSDVYEHFIDVLPPLDDRDALRDADARALTEYLHPSDRDGPEQDGPRYVFSSARQKHAVFDRLFRRFVRRRRTVVWLDDLQWGRESIALLEYFVASHQPPPVLVLGTLRSDLLARDDDLTRRLRAIEEQTGATRIVLDPLGREENLELVSRLLPLDDSATQLLSGRMEGNPLFGVQLLTNWVEKSAIVPSPEGLKVVPDAAIEVPDDIHLLWLDRVARLIEHLGDSVSAGISLELAATLGREVRWDEWIAVCGAAGIEVSSRLSDEFIDRGLARATDEGWRFTHGLLVDSIARMAQDGGRWEEHHAMCAEMLGALYVDEPHRTARRRARHWIAAGRAERAVEPLREEAMRLGVAGERAAAQEIFLERRDVLDALAIGDDDPRRLENEIEVMFYRSVDGTAREHLQDRAPTLHERVKAVGDARLLARSAGLIAKLSEWDGKPADARRWAEVSMTSARASGDERAMEAAAWQLGVLLFQAGELDEAEATFSQAYEDAVRLGRTFAELRARHMLVPIAMSRGDRERARRIGTEVLEAARAAGARTAEAHCLNALGELERLDGNADRAREYYRAFAESARELNHPVEEIGANLNLVLTAFMERDFRSAEAALDWVCARCQELRLGMFSSYLLLSQMVLAAESGDWRAFDEALAALQPWPDANAVEMDHPWLLEIAGDVAHDAEEIGRAHRTWRFAEELWSRLGNGDAVDQVRAKRAAAASPCVS